MVSFKKYIYFSSFIILLLLFAACIYTVEDNTAFPEDAKDDLTIIAGFSREGGVALK